MTSSLRILAVFSVLALGACQKGEKAPPPDESKAIPAARGHDTGWNDDDIAWRSSSDGLAEAKRTGKPACVVVFATWCPHCSNYRAVFADPRIVEAARRVVMIRIDADAEPGMAQRFAPDGEYVPRTLMVAADGSIRTDIRARGDQYAYFYDEANPEHLLGALQRAAL